MQDILLLASLKFGYSYKTHTGFRHSCIQASKRMAEDGRSSKSSPCCAAVRTMKINVVCPSKCCACILLAYFLMLFRFLLFHFSSFYYLFSPPSSSQHFSLRTFLSHGRSQAKQVLLRSMSLTEISSQQIPALLGNSSTLCLFVSLLCCNFCSISSISAFGLKTLVRKVLSAFCLSHF